MNDFPLTPEELHAALSSTYWKNCGWGTKQDGL